MPTQKEIGQTLTPITATTPEEEELDKNWGVAYSARSLRDKKRNDPLRSFSAGRKRKFSHYSRSNKDEDNTINGPKKKMKRKRKKEKRPDKIDTKAFKVTKPKRY